MNLRPYQSSALSGVSRVLHRKPILVAPTGSGKTVMATELSRRLNAAALWVAHRRELIFQAAKHLRNLGAQVRLVLAGSDPEGMHSIFDAETESSGPVVYVASIQTLNRREIPRVAVIFIDECHHASADGYADLFTLGVPVVGLTATPFRLDGKPLGDLFGSMVVAAHTDELCQQGVLHAPQVFSCGDLPLSAVRMTGGDFNLADLSKRVNEPTLIGDIVREWKKHYEFQTSDNHGLDSNGDAFRTVCFAVDVKHSRAITEAFNAAGVNAEHLDGTTPAATRDAILARLASGETQIVSNCMVLTEGWDLPALECAIIARPTASLNLHLQMVGRIMRSAEDKSGALVLDHAGNHHRHGPVTRRLEYSLNGEVKPVASSEPLGLKRCADCGLMVPCAAPCCTGCGVVFEIEERRIVVADGDLVEFDDSSFEYRDTFWKKLLVEASDQGFSEGWSFFRFKERFGVAPVAIEGQLVDPRRTDMAYKQWVYEGLLRVADEKGFKEGWASYRYKDVFGVWPKGFVTNVKAGNLNARWASNGAVA